MTRRHGPSRTRSMSFGAALGTATCVLLGAVGFSGHNLSDLESTVATGSITTGGLGVLTQGLVTPPAPVPVAPDTFNLYLVACSDDAFSVTGASVGVEYG